MRHWGSCLGNRPQWRLAIIRTLAIKLTPHAILANCLSNQKILVTPLTCHAKIGSTPSPPFATEWTAQHCVLVWLFTVFPNHHRQWWWSWCAVDPGGGGDCSQCCSANQRTPHFPQQSYRLWWAHWGTVGCPGLHLWRWNPQLIRHSPHQLHNSEKKAYSLLLNTKKIGRVKYQPSVAANKSFQQESVPISVEPLYVSALHNQDTSIL